MTPRTAGALTMLLPLALVIPLLWRDLPPPSLLQSILAPTAIAILALGAAAFAVGARYFRPGYSLEPNRWGLVLALAGIGLYFMGSVQSISALHWAAGAMLYVGAVIYIGGPYSAAVALPLAFAAFAAASGLAQNLLVDVPLGIVLTAYIAATFRLDSANQGAQDVACAHCEKHLRRGSDYCSYCGRRLALPWVWIGRGKVGAVLLASLVLLLVAQAQPVTLNATRSGIYYATYSTSGMQVQPLLSTPPQGWKIANVTNTSLSGVPSMSYDLAKPGSVASLVVTLSPSPYDAAPIASGNHSKISMKGNVEVSNQSLTEYALTSGSGAALTGLIWSTPISYVSGGTVSTGLLSFQATEPTAAYNANGGSDLKAIASSLLGRLNAAQNWNVYLGSIGSYILNYDSYIVPSVGAIAVLLFVGSLRGRELKGSRVVDGTFGLSREEFSLYATLVRAAPLQTGEAYEAKAVTKGVRKWDDFSEELGRLERLGLMSRQVRVRGGTPRLFWKCELA